jgi:hypothetical protein
LVVKSGNVELRIEELVLHGFGSADHDRIGEAVERELARLFAEGGVPPSLTREAGVDRIDGGAFEAQPGSGTEAIGTLVARAVYGGLGA